MKHLLLALILSPLALAAAVETDDAFEEECELNRFYAGAAGTAFLPQGGGDSRHLAGATGRVGWYINEFWAIEGEAAWLENSAGLGVDILWHWWGYERLDPFFTFGAKGWIGATADDVGPKVGIGSFYHLTDALSIRFDADATLGLDGDEKMNYTISAGLQWSF